MIRSMTGFGRAECLAANRKILIEIRCLNSKQLDLSVRLPYLLREYEQAIRTEVSTALVRGKVEVFVSQETTAAEDTASINTALLRKYHAEMTTLIAELGLTPPPDPLTTLLRFPDVFKPERDSLPEDEWLNVQQALKEAITAVDHFRLQEGQGLSSDLQYRTGLILQYLQETEPFEAERIQTIRQRILRNLDESLKNMLPDQNRFEQEMIYYLERLDVTEEKTRLKQHCQYFLTTLESEAWPGKKLGFIAQEMGREINTLGSKANEMEIQRRVVMMKDELEKMKEQLFNVL